MTKLLIGLGLLIIAGALFGLLSLLWSRLFPEMDGSADAPAGGEKKEPLRAVVHCTGGGAGFTKYNYQGVTDCLAASCLPGGGPLGCDHGCLGMGTCAKVCPYGAIRLREGVAVVDGERCRACGKCVEACPRHIISLEPFRPKRHVSIPCASCAGEEETREECTDGCVGCGQCAESCPKGAITVEEGLARIDYETCDHCGQCVQTCPRHLIRVEKVTEPPAPEPPRPPRQPKPRKERPPKPPREPRPQKEKPSRQPKPKKEKPSKPVKEPLPQKEKQAEEGEKPRRKLPKLELPRLELEKKLPGKDPHGEKASPVESVPGEAGTGKETAEETVHSGPPVPKTVDTASVEEKKEESAAPKTSAEAFEAFQQVVAAAGEALGEEKKEETQEAPSAPTEEATKTE